MTSKDAPDRSGLKWLAIAVTTCACAFSLTYLVPALANLRPWAPGEDIPLSRLVSFEGKGETAAMEEEAAQPMDGESAKRSVESSLGGAIASALGEDAGVETADDESPVQLASAAGVVIAPEEIAGLERRIEDPGGHAMDSFYASLMKTAEGRAGAITRIAHWGDSTIAADDVTRTLRRRLQKRFGDAGHGFHLVSKGTMPYAHRDVSHSADTSWRFYAIPFGGLKDGRYGYGGVRHASDGGASASYGTVEKGPIGRAVSRFEVWYQSHAKGGNLEVQVDKGDRKTISTRKDVITDEWLALDVPDGPHRLHLRAGGKGETRVYGVTMERAGPGVVYDSLGVVGCRATRLLHADQEHLKVQIAHRSPDLLVLAFGGNEAGDKGMKMDVYERKLGTVIRRVRAGRPEASCLLFAPLDQGEMGPRGKVRTIPLLPKIIESQRKVAFEQGCAYFDTFQAMGGDGAMGRWYKAKPRLGWGDFRHATPAGYEVVANLFYKALLDGFSKFTARPPSQRVPQVAENAATTDTADDLPPEEVDPEMQPY